MIVTDIYVMPRDTSKSTWHTQRDFKAVPRVGEIIELGNDDGTFNPYKVTEVRHTPDEEAHDIAITVSEI